jgi:membrane fusion protein (multidrug efflux system)
MSDQSPEPANGNHARRRGLLILAAVVVLAGLAYAIYWMTVARYYEDTDDAYVASDIVQVTSEVAGTVLGVHVDDTQTVERGQRLVDLDPADARIGVAAAEADLARTVREVRSLFSQADQLRAEIAAHETDLKRAEGDFSRRQSLISDGAVSGEELAHARDTIAQLHAGLEAARRQLDATLAQIEGTTFETHPEVLASAAKLRDMSLALRRTTISAPVSGVIAKRGVQLGQHVAAGAPLLAVVPLDDVWVDANFKEGQLTYVRVGQPVELHADIYGNDVEYRGTVAGLAAGSGNAFALLPSQNASGNWIKIVQRVPVRILLDPQQLKEHPLRVGLSMEARIDLHDTSGPVVSTRVRTTPQPVQKSDGDDPAVEQRIAEIIHENASDRAAVATNRRSAKAAQKVASAADKERQ